MNTDFWLGIATVLAITYCAFGVVLTVEAVRHDRPSQWRHNQSPLTWGPLAYKNYVFWPAISLMPIAWPLLIILFRWDFTSAKKRHNKFSKSTRSPTAIPASEEVTRHVEKR